MANILIVDDSRLIRSVAEDATREVGHNPITAENGQIGLDFLSRENIELIFSDVNMPVMGGIEMVENIKNDENYKFIPIVMLTTESNEDLKNRGKELGVKAWMLKPFNKKKFSTVIKKLIGN